MYPSFPKLKHLTVLSGNINVLTESLGRLKWQTLTFGEATVGWLTFKAAALCSDGSCIVGSYVNVIEL